MKSKRAMAMNELAGIILTIMIVIVVFTVYLTVIGVLGPKLGASICGANVRVRQVAFSMVGGWGKEAVPLWMCKQHMNTIKIDVNDYGKCAGLNRAICDNPKKYATSACNARCVQSQCQAQCARIQVDELVNLCWTMAGRGRDTIEGALAKLGREWYVKDDVVGLRCFKFQITAGNNAEKKDFYYQDGTGGRSSLCAVEGGCTGAGLLLGGEGVLPEIIANNEGVHTWTERVRSAEECGTTTMCTDDNCFSSTSCAYGGYCKNGICCYDTANACDVTRSRRAEESPWLALGLAQDNLLDYSYYKRDVCYISYYDVVPLAVDKDNNYQHATRMVGTTCSNFWLELPSNSKMRLLN